MVSVMGKLEWDSILVGWCVEGLERLLGSSTFVNRGVLGKIRKREGLGFESCRKQGCPWQNTQEVRKSGLENRDSDMGLKSLSVVGFLRALVRLHV